MQEGIRKLSSVELRELFDKSLLEVFNNETLPFLIDAGFLDSSIKDFSDFESNISGDEKKIVDAVHEVFKLYTTYNLQYRKERNKENIDFKIFKQEDLTALKNFLQADTSADEKILRINTFKQNAILPYVHNYKEVMDDILKESGSREENIANWHEDSKRDYNDFFKDSWEGRVAFAIPRISGVKESISQLERDYQLKIDYDKSASKFHMYYEGEKETLKPIKFLKNFNIVLVQAKAFVSGFDALTELDKSALSPKDLQKLQKYCALSWSEQDYGEFYESFLVEGALESSSNNKYNVLFSILDKDIILDIILKELDNHQEKDLESFLISLGDVQNKVRESLETLEDFASRMLKGDTSSIDNSVDYLIFSKRDEDLVLEDTYKSWNSCMHLNGCNKKYLKSDVNEGCVVVFAVNGDSPHNPVGRTLLKPYFEEVVMNFVSDLDSIVRVDDERAKSPVKKSKKGRLHYKSYEKYGKINAEVLTMVEKIKDSIFNMPTTYLGKISPDIYKDGAQDRVFLCDKEKFNFLDALSLLNIDYSFDGGGCLVFSDDIFPVGCGNVDASLLSFAHSLKAADSAFKFPKEVTMGDLTSPLFMRVETISDIVSIIYMHIAQNLEVRGFFKDEIVVPSEIHFTEMLIHPETEATFQVSGVDYSEIEQMAKKLKNAKIVCDKIELKADGLNIPIGSSNLLDIDNVIQNNLPRNVAGGKVFLDALKDICIDGECAEDVMLSYCNDAKKRSILHDLEMFIEARHSGYENKPMEDSSPGGLPHKKGGLNIQKLENCRVSNEFHGRVAFSYNVDMQVENFLIDDNCDAEIDFSCISGVSSDMRASLRSLMAGLIGRGDAADEEKSLPMDLKEIKIGRGFTGRLGFLFNIDLTMNDLHLPSDFRGVVDFRGCRTRDDVFEWETDLSPEDAKKRVILTRGKALNVIPVKRSFVPDATVSPILLECASL